MKKYITKLILFCTLFCSTIACDVSDGQKPSLKAVSFSGSIEASSKSLLLFKSKEKESVINISWPAVTYPVNAPVTYTLQFDIPANISGDKAWSKSIRVVAGEDVLSKSMIGKELNRIALELGLREGVFGKIAVRVESNLDRAVYSDVIFLDVTAFSSDTWGIIGTATAGSWNSSTEMSYDDQLKIWKFTGALKSGALKFRLNDSWKVNYGPKNGIYGIMHLDSPDAHTIDLAGNYEVTFSIKAKDPITGIYPPTVIYTVKKI
jgi:starch-binding outer membrane protein SusE/F